MLKRCELHIELNRPNAIHRGGEPLEGAVVVHVTADCDLNHLTVALQWRTHGKGNQTTGPERWMRLAGGTNWRAGETHRIPFRMETPLGPVSYHGHNINIDWYLSARADVPWAIDSHTETEVFVGSSTTVPWHPSYQHFADPLAAGGEFVLQAARVTPKGLAILMTVMVAMLLWITWPLVDDGGIVWGSVITVIAFTASAAAVCFGMLRNTIARSKLGPLTISAPSEAIPGRDLNVSLAMQPSRSVTINRVYVELVGREIAISGSGTNRTTHEFKFYRDLSDATRPPQQHYRATSEALRYPHHIAPGKPFEVAATLNVPPDAPPTFRATNNHIAWTAIVHVDIPRWPDLREEHHLSVPPAGATTAVIQSQ